MMWTEEREHMLSQLWSEGLSASQIAGRLGGVTRNSVIGKAHRLGLTGKAPTKRGHKRRDALVPPATRRAPRTTPPRTRTQEVLHALLATSSEPATPTQEELVIPLKERAYFHTLTTCNCHWPIGDPNHPDFHFFGKNAVPGMSYCTFHIRKAYQPRRRRSEQEQDTELSTG